MGFLILLIFILAGTKPISAMGEGQKNEALYEKFRVLLGLGSLHHETMYGSPAPAPAPAPMEAQAPSPVLQPLPFHPHHRHPAQLNLPRRQIHGHREMQSARRRVLVGAAVAVGATLLIVGLVGVLCFVKKCYWKRMERCGSERGKDPGLDLFYVDTLAGVLEPETPFKQNPSEGGESKDSVEEIASVDESFHSLCESNASNNDRVSNVSLSSSFNDAMERFSSTVQDSNIETQPCVSFEDSSSIIEDSKFRPAPPPPPPPPSSKIPPPPCPPLFMKGSVKDGTPLPKLKPLHWDKVRATPDRCMVWDKLRSSSFEFDEKMIESLFGYNLKNAFQNDEGKSKTPSPNKHVLEPKRLQNMTILSKAVNVTVEQVCEALAQGDGLRLQQLEALAKMEPTKEEETNLSNYDGNIDELGSPERLVKAMLNIPFAFQRIEAMLFKATFEDEVVHLRNSFSMLEEACKELRSSRLFLKLLEAVLKTGNRMNVGTIRGGAKAFKLDALLKLADVKGADGKTTLLHFVVLEIIKSEGVKMADSIMGKIHRPNRARTEDEKEEDYKKMGLDLVSGLTTELCNVKKTASIDLDVLATSVSNLSDAMAKLQKLVLEDLSKDEANGEFVGVMKAFMAHAEESLREVQEHEGKVSRSVKEITEYFHGEVERDESNLLHIFVIVRDFLAMLDQVCRELKSLKGPKTPYALAQFH